MSKNSVITLDEFKTYFCDTYIRTLCPAERPFYSEQIITWRKMKKIVAQGDVEELKRKPTCYRLYKSFLKNLYFIIDNRDKTPIEYLMLPTSINNSLKRQEIYFIEDLENSYKSVEKLCSIRKIGEIFSDAILKALKEWDADKKKIIDQ